MATMTAEEAAEWGKTLSFEKVWAALMENREQQKKDEQLLREIQKAMAEIQVKTQRAIAETQKAMAEYQKAMAKTQKMVAKIIWEAEKAAADIDELERSMWKLLEILAAARLGDKFTGYPYNLKRVYQRVPLFDENIRIKTNIDILLSGAEWVMAIKVDWDLNRKDDVDEHVNRLALIRKYPPAETMGKRLVGAMVGETIDPDVKDYAHKRGLFVLELTDGAVSLLPPPEGFAPQEW